MLDREPTTLPTLRELFRQKPAGVATEIAAADGMYQGDVEHYFRVGQSALQGIRLALLAAGKDTLHRILDLPCGYGRALRAIRADFPAAQLAACDLETEGVDFCAREFGAMPVYGHEQPEEIVIAGDFDLIFCGSLLTHLEADKWIAFLQFFSSHLAPGGIVVFTTHGRWIPERLARGEESYGLEPEQTRRLLDDYARTGFGFGSYFHSETYGISASTPAWVCNLLAQFPELRLLTFTERGWDNHQDIVACVRPT